MSEDRLWEYLFSGKGASVDSRTLQPGEVFFALPGTRSHGASFAGDAWSRGAAFLVLPVDFPPPPHVPRERIFYHAEPLRLLGEIAAAYRQRFSIPLVAIGGSNGKTTTKALLGHMLSQQAPTLISPKSWNNAIGLPLTLLRLRPEHRFAVIEIGDNRPGEVQALCEMAQPTVGLLTNVGQDHLAGYGTLEANRLAKWEMAEYLRLHPGGLLFLNREDPWLATRPSLPGVAVKYYGNGSPTLASGRWQPMGWECSRLEGELDGHPFCVEVPLWGSFNRLNVLAALAVGYTLGFSVEVLGRALGSFKGEAYRSQVVRRGSQVFVLDAYNANPSSLAASLTSLWETLESGQKAALILGQMEELGDFSERAHREAVEMLLQHAQCIEGVVFVGPLWLPVLHAGLTVPWKWRWVEDVAELRKADLSWLAEVAIIYLKGSRTQALERFLLEEG
ncbi:MAG: Mur ligase family protein [Bacteroidia bacterium]|nr:Mur ligase family protein [Bacteroidia bacterium]